MSLSKLNGVTITAPATIFGVSNISKIWGIDIASGGGFTPPAGTVAWYKADELVGFSDNDPVGTWTDDSGDGNDSVGSGSTRPLYKTAIQNGLPIVRFDGTDDYLEVSGGPMLGTQPFTVHMVALNRNTTASVFPLVGGNQWRCGRWGNDGKSAMSAGSLVQGSASDIPVNAAHQLTYVFDGASSKVYVDGVEKASGDAGSQSMDDLYLGRFFNGGSFEFGQVDLGEVLVRLGGRDTATEDYMQAKWATP